MAKVPLAGTDWVPGRTTRPKLEALSKNLVELVRRHHGEAAPTALEVLKEAIDDARRDHRRRPPRRRRALRPARGDGLRRLDLLRRPAAAARARATCASAPAPPASPRPATRTSTEPRAGSGSSSASAATTASVSLAETVCLGFCHSSPGGPRRRRDRRRARTSSSACSPARRAQAARARLAVSLLDEPVLTRPRRLVRAARARSSELDARGSCSRRSRRPRSAAAAAPASPPAQKWEFARARRGRREVHRRQRRRGRPRLLHRQVPDGAQPGAAARGDGARRLRGRRRARLRAHAARSTRCSKPALEAAAAGRAREGLLGDGHPRQRLRLRRDDRRGRRLLRRRRGDGAARLPAGAARHGLRAPAVPRRSAALHGMPTVVNNVETLCNIPFIARARRRRLPRPQPRARRPGTKLVCFNERFARPGVYEVPFGMTVRELCEDARRRPARRARRSRRCRSAARSAGSCRLASSTPPFDFDAARGRGLHGRPRRDPRLRRPDRHARRRPPPAALRRRTRAAASASRAGSGCARAHEMFADGRAGRPRAARGRCWRRSSSAASARTAAACRRRSAACSTHFPEELGLA